MKDALLILVGPTGIGKTELALRLAERFNAEIIGVDSMQVYRCLDIGTAKPTLAERARVPHHLVDFVDPAENYTAARFVADALKVIEGLTRRNKLPFLVGGTGMYLKGLLEGLFEAAEEGEDDEGVRLALKKKLAAAGRDDLYKELQQCDPESAARIHPNDTQRLLRALEIFRKTGVPWSHHLGNQQPARDRLPRHILKLGLTCGREQLYARINKRVEFMLAQGLQAEVEKLLAAGYDPELKALQSIGYRHMVNYLAGHWQWAEMVELLARDTRRYAKRQYTWFKKDPEIHWFETSQQDEIFNKVYDFLAGVKRQEEDRGQ